MKKLDRIYAKILKGRYSLGDLEVDERMILKCMFNLLATDFFFQILAHPVFKM
jgi:hypothetical protein